MMSKASFKIEMKLIHVNTQDNRKGFHETLSQRWCLVWFTIKSPGQPLSLLSSTHFFEGQPSNVSQKPIKWCPNRPMPTQTVRKKSGNVIKIQFARVVRPFHKRRLCGPNFFLSFGTWTNLISVHTAAVWTWMEIKGFLNTV